MNSIPEKILKIKWIKEWHDPNVLDYIRTGNPAALQRIPALGHGGSWAVSEALPSPPDWNPEADRVIELSTRFKLTSLITNWLDRFCRYSNAGWEHFHAALDILKKNGVDQSWIDSALIKATLIDYNTLQPTEAGLLLLEYNDERLVTLFKNNFAHVIHSSCFDQFATVLASRDPDRLDALLASPWGQARDKLNWAMILPANPGRYHEQARAGYEKNAEPNPRLAFVLAEARPELYREWAIGELLKICGAFPGEPVSRGSIESLLELDAPGTFEAVNTWMADAGPGDLWNIPFQREMILKIYRERYPDRVMPAIEAMARGNAPILVAAGLRLWKAEGIGEGRELFHDAIRRLLVSQDSKWIIHGLKEAAIDSAVFASELWAFMEHKSAPVRAAAIRTLSALGFSSLKEKAKKLLHGKKADLRLSAVILLHRVGGPEAVTLLKERLETEESEAVRDAILLALDAAGGITLGLA